MQNQGSSPNPEALPGTTIGPVDALWIEFITPYGELDPVQVAGMKYIFYSSAVMMYNLMTTSIRSDLTLVTMSIVSEAMRLNIETYFASIQAPASTQLN